MFLCVAKQIVAFRPNLAHLVKIRVYTHEKNKIDPTSHIGKHNKGVFPIQESKTGKPTSDKKSKHTAPVKKPRITKIVVDPSTDEKFRECRIFVSNLPLTANWKDLKDHFKGAGVNYVSISKDRVTEKSKGCGIVQFDSIEQCESALTDLQGSLLLGSPIKIWRDRKRIVAREAVSKTVHSLPNIHKLRGDVKTSAEFIETKVEKENTTDAGQVASNSVDDSQPLPQPEKFVEKKFIPEYYKRDPRDSTEVSDEELNQIEFLVDIRTDCRNDFNYKKSDEIRLRLRNEFRVQCDDVGKTWRVLSEFLEDGTPRPKRAR